MTWGSTRSPDSCGVLCRPPAEQARVILAALSLARVTRTHPITANQPPPPADRPSSSPLLAYPPAPGSHDRTERILGLPARPLPFGAADHRTWLADQRIHRQLPPEPRLRLLHLGDVAPERRLDILRRSRDEFHRADGRAIGVLGSQHGTAITGIHRRCGRLFLDQRGRPDLRHRRTPAQLGRNHPADEWNRLQNLSTS